LVNLVNSNGKIVLSGIMKQQLGELISNYGEYCSIKQIKERNNWCLVELLKNC